MWIESNTPELAVPYLWSEEKQSCECVGLSFKNSYMFPVLIVNLSTSCSAPIGQAVHQMLLIQAFRPDRLLAMSHIFVSKVLGEAFMNIIEQPLDLANIVDNEVRMFTNLNS